MFKVKDTTADNEKIDLANLICSNDQGLSHPNMTKCEIYGMTWGCDKDCPAFQRGECELQEEVEKQLEGVNDYENGELLEK